MYDLDEIGVKVPVLCFVHTKKLIIVMLIFTSRYMYVGQHRGFLLRHGVNKSVHTAIAN